VSKLTVRLSAVVYSAWLEHLFRLAVAGFGSDCAVRLVTPAVSVKNRLVIHKPTTVVTVLHVCHWRMASLSVSGYGCWATGARKTSQAAVFLSWRSAVTAGLDGYTAAWRGGGCGADDGWFCCCSSRPRTAICAICQLWDGQVQRTASWRAWLPGVTSSLDSEDSSSSSSSSSSSLRCYQSRLYQYSPVHRCS